MLEQSTNCNAVLMSMELSVFAAFQDNVMLCTAAGCQEKVDSWFTRDNDQIRGGSVKLEGGWFNWDRLGQGTFGAFIARRHHIVRLVPQPTCLWK